MTKINIAKMRKQRDREQRCDQRIAPSPRDPGPYTCELPLNHRGWHKWTTYHW